MSGTKAQNYSPEQVQEMREEYSEATTQETRDAVVLAVAERFGKSKRSIVSKMSREGFYVAKATVSKVTGEKPAKKEDLAVILRKVSGLPMVSAEKMNKTDIQDLITHFKEVNEVPAEFEGDDELENAQVEADAEMEGIEPTQTES